MKKAILLTILILACLVLAGAGCKKSDTYPTASDEQAENPAETKAIRGEGTEFNPTWKDYINPVKWFMPVYRTVPATEKNIPDAPKAP